MNYRQYVRLPAWKALCWVVCVASVLAAGFLTGCAGASRDVAASERTPLENFEANRAFSRALDVRLHAEGVIRDIRSAPPSRAEARGGASQRSAATRWRTGPDRDTAVVLEETDDDAVLFDSLCAPYEDLSGEALWTEIFDTIDGHYVLGYRRARDHMYGLSKPYVDVFNDEIEDAYTGRRVTPDGSRTPGDTNTEHSWPQSKGTRTGPSNSDLHHLFVVDRYSNSRRQNYEFGAPECGESGQPKCRWVSENHGDDEQPSRIGLNDAGDPIFEVRSSRRGDVARAQFYIALRYDMTIEEDTEKVLRQWHAEDPPDGYERARNARIEKVQNNRNPFVDCPELVERIDRFAPAAK